jgi:hypothetical protein
MSFLRCVVRGGSAALYRFKKEYRFILIPSERTRVPFRKKLEQRIESLRAHLSYRARQIRNCTCLLFQRAQLQNREPPRVSFRKHRTTEWRASTKTFSNSPPAERGSQKERTSAEHCQARKNWKPEVRHRTEVPEREHPFKIFSQARRKLETVVMAAPAELSPIRS